MRKQLKAPFDNYFIDEYGLLFNKDNHQMKPYINFRGYYSVELYHKNNPKESNSKEIHRFVAEHFLDSWNPNLNVDHIDMNKLNNHYLNLRMCTKSQNAMNRTKQIDNKSGFKGVYWNTQKNKWIAQCKKDGKQHYLGSYDNKLDAARAYMEGAKKLHGEFARSTSIPVTDDDFFNMATTIPLPESPKPKLKIKFI